MTEREFFQARRKAEKDTFILFDAIHHRGQLSTYIRPMGGQVPAIYGPSGDSRR
jgi:uncharacterized damage-inducible protein DinB